MKNIENIGIDCVGCGSCAQICPQHCISMKQDDEGFVIPAVDIEKCTDCGICKKHCPTENNFTKDFTQTFYGLKNKDVERIMNSASGGASDVFANWIVGQGGVVYGCAYDDNLRVKHIQINDKNDLWRIQSSKYVQSDIGDCYKLAKRNLEKGIKVLFTGTPCQIAGLYSYLGRDDEPDLYTVDLICHGVPSPLFFEKYLEYLDKKLGEKVISYNFRSKNKRGWGTQYEYITKTKTKTKTGTVAIDKYGYHFMKGDCYRESCYNCRYANLNRVSDITIGDFWGVDKCKPNFFSEKGVSSIIVNSQKGEKLFSAIKDKVDWIEVEKKDVLLKQGNLRNATSRLDKRSSFYKFIDEEGFMENIKMGICLKERIKGWIPKKLIRVIKKYC